MSEIRVVIVEDEFLIADYLSEVCASFDVNVEGIAYKPEEALTLIMETKPDFVLMDVRLKHEQDGVDVAKKIFAVIPETKIVFITGSNEPSTIERINTDHPYRILIKPINPKDLKEALLGA